MIHYQIYPTALRFLSLSICPVLLVIMSEQIDVLHSAVRAAKHWSYFKLCSSLHWYKSLKCVTRLSISGSSCAGFASMNSINSNTVWSLFPGYYRAPVMLYMHSGAFPYDKPSESYSSFCIRYIFLEWMDGEGVVINFPEFNAFHFKALKLLGNHFDLRWRTLQFNSNTH